MGFNSGFKGLTLCRLVNRYGTAVIVYQSTQRDILEDLKSSGLPLREPQISQILIYYPTLREMETRQAMYVERNMEARSRNHCCCGKAITITYCVCVCEENKSGLQGKWGCRVSARL